MTSDSRRGNGGGGPVRGGSAASKGSRNARRKRQVRELLVKRDLPALRQWAEGEHNPLRTVSSLLFDGDLAIRWRAIEGLGVVAEVETHRDLERVRRLMRRILWLMNDESGGICWNGPEAIGEVVANVPALVGEFGKLIPSFFKEEPFERGSRWAVARMAAVDPTAFEHAIATLVSSLDDPDPAIRGLSLLALKALGGPVAPETLKALLDDPGTLSIYDFQTGTLEQTTVGALCRESL